MTKFAKGNKAAQSRKIKERELWDSVFTYQDKVEVIRKVRDAILEAPKIDKNIIRLIEWSWERMYGRPMQQEGDEEREFVLKLTGNEKAVELVMSQIKPANGLG